MNQIGDRSKELEWTGERYVPFVHGDIEIEHLHRYAFAREFVLQKDVLDIASGEGYGSYLLAGGARTVIGVDISKDAVLHAQTKYVAPNLQFRHGDCRCIPLDNNSVDIVISFETIEHHDQHDVMLAEIKRVLRLGGMLIISTPERDFDEACIQKRNDFHVKELSQLEFRTLLLCYFRNIKLVGQRVRYGSLISPIDSSEEGQQFSFHSGTSASVVSQLIDPNPLFLIAFASESSIGFQKASFFDGTDFLSHAMASLRLDRDALRTEVDRVKQTLSWRFTKPFRYFWNMVRRFLGNRVENN